MRKKVMESANDLAPTEARALRLDRAALPTEKLQWLHAAAQRAGLECLATEWKGRLVTYALRCGNGHQFTRLGSNIFDKPVCKECRNHERLKRLQAFAQAKGGQCLESTYLGKVPHRFLCARGHRWATHAQNVLVNGNWCQRCVNIERAERMTKQDGLAELQGVVAARGGQCLNDTYIGSNRRYRFQCAEGHEWQTTAGDILLGSWCKYCAAKAIGERHRAAGLQRLQRTLEKRGGVCLGDYAGSQEKHRFRCHNGHEWEAIATSINMGKWCSQCVKDRSKALRTERLQKIVLDLGGLLLSEYVNAKTKLHLECDRGHRWHALPNNTLKGHWCPECAHLSQISNPKSAARRKYQTSSQSLGERL